jgi:hypothetical protein
MRVRLRIGGYELPGVNMVRMRVGIDDAVDRIDLGRQHLHSEIRPGIDQHSGRALGTAFETLDQRGAPRAIVPRVFRIAGTPVSIDPGHARGGATPEDG